MVLTRYLPTSYRADMFGEVIPFRVAVILKTAYSVSDRQGDPTPRRR